MTIYGNVTINGNVIVANNHDNVSKARDTLLTRMYYAREKPTLGGYSTWKWLLDRYYCGEYYEMYDYISHCPKSATRSICLKALSTIMGGENEEI